MSAFAERVDRMREPRPYPVNALAQALGIPPADTNTLALRVQVGRRTIAATGNGDSPSPKPTAGPPEPAYTPPTSGPAGTTTGSAAPP